MDMNVSTQTQEKTPRVRVELDGDSVLLPQEMENSLIAIRAYLEFLALQKRRVLSGFIVDGVEVQQVTSHLSESSFRIIQADTITFEQLSQRLVNTASRQLNQLAAELEDYVLRVLINDRDRLLQQWRKWAPLFRSPLVNLGFMRELWGDTVDGITLGNITLLEHLDELNGMLCEVDAVFLATEHDWTDEDAMVLSTLFEERLVPWLKVLEVYMLKLGGLPLD